MAKQPPKITRALADSLLPGKPELIVIVDPADGIRALPEGLVSQTGADVRGLREVLDKAKVSLKALFPAAQREAFRADRSATVDDPGLARFFHITAPEEELEELSSRFQRVDEVQGVYVKPAGGVPLADDITFAPAAPPSEAPAQTPRFSDRQLYLGDAPGGVDARFAWSLAGGRGAGVKIIDCEWGWRFDHEDLRQLHGGVAIGFNSEDDNHGTAVVGTFSGDSNDFGIEGLCADAFVIGASFGSGPTSQVIYRAADRLRPGDILLLEIHRAGPDANGIGQDGYIPIEWWPDDFAAIRYAVSRGILVVEAAGNGARNLDAPVFGEPDKGFPIDWKNPFNPRNPSSGAILVGAGTPPPGTHNQDFGPDRSRLQFSNFGARVDAQAWGKEVTTTGYGDLQWSSDRDLLYTDIFNGTSSASPIVVGALGCVQGILKAYGRPLLTPESARQLLRETGSPQQDSPTRPATQRIGNRPSIRQMLARLIPDIKTSDRFEAEAAITNQPVPKTASGAINITIQSSQVTFHLTSKSS